LILSTHAAWRGEHSLRLLRRIGAVFDNLLVVLAIVACGIFAFLWLSVNLEVVLRYFLRMPQTWVLEFATYCMLYITFLGAAWLLRSEGHVRLDSLVKRLSPKNQILMSTITSILGAITCGIVAWYSTIETWDVFQRGIDFSMSILKIKKGPILIILPIGTFLLCIQFARLAYGYFRSWRMPAEKILEAAKGVPKWDGS